MILFAPATESLVDEALAELAIHVPEDVEIGEPRAARITDGLVLIHTLRHTVWMVGVDATCRMVMLGDGAHCITTWRDGVLLGDVVGDVDYDDPQEA